jgi:uncharacterized C2H2 Zn-finger protein
MRKIEDKELVVKRLSGEKIALCPHCQQELEYLECYSEARQEFRLDEQGEAVYLDADINEDGEGRFECPHCMEELTDDEEEAKDFLKGVRH